SGQLLEGPYSRFQWHHPGPMYFYLLAPFYGATGHRAAGLNAGAVAINLAALVAIIHAAAGAGSAPMAMGIAFGSTLYLWRAHAAIASAWNPHVVVLPVMAVVVLSGAVASGRLWLLPLVAAFASLAAQTHVALVPVSLLLGAGAVLIGLRPALTHPSDRVNVR